MAGGRSTVHSAIVLQGGGALGAYECGVLQALYEQRPGFTPVVITGISSGAINAAVLGGAKDDDPISALIQLWCDRFTVSPPFPARLPSGVDRYLSVLGNPGMYRPNLQLALAPWRAESLYDPAPLASTLSEVLDVNKLNRQQPEVVVGAINVATGEMKYFDRDGPDGLTVNHVIASGSLPPGFPMVELDKQRYWDGGLFSNLPLAPAINALERAAGGDRSATRELIVVELFPMSAPIPRNLLEVHQRMIQLQYTSRLKLDAEFFGKIGRFVDLMAEVDDLMARVEGQFPRAGEIRADKTYKELLQHRKIDHFNVVTSTLGSGLSNAGDFSRSTIDQRIQAGHEDALKQRIGQVDSPGLRPGTTSA
jgi:NTE family protein